MQMGVLCNQMGKKQGKKAMCESFLYCKNDIQVDSKLHTKT
jgi:hypothetical protein